MKVGDLVKAMGARRSRKILVGIIIKHKPLNDHTLEAYEVLTSDGKIDIYTSAALRTYGHQWK